MLIEWTIYKEMHILHSVTYGSFDMERILRLMRPSKEEVLIKDSGMHAVENFIMSRYQMYWQIYFHPVSRGGKFY